MHGHSALRYSLAWPKYYLMTLLVIVLSGCANNKPDVKVDKTQNFAAIQTFYIQAPLNPVNSVLQQHLETAISQQLTAKGLIASSPQEADVSVGYFPSNTTKEDGSSFSLGLGTGSYGRSGGVSIGSIFNIPVGEQVSVHQHLQIDIVKDGRFIYSATGSIKLESKDSISIQAKLDELVDKLLEDYPTR
ncbi:hypothetical protein D210916BOD24_07470 [Alteromonas sp. D210916BOD_24]|uniref:DUF4136 domain-containing protein n=1 Tax=Alteromonas sp. D210916BOD_24 TaxID=3157618 RepID=UPI00399C95A5